MAPAVCVSSTGRAGGSGISASKTSASAGFAAGRRRPRGEVRLDANKIGIVRRATHRCRRLWCVGGSRRWFGLAKQETGIDFIVFSIGLRAFCPIF
jgi:hypothetical protein